MNFYEILVVERDASRKEIKKARNEQLKKWHPDVSGGSKKKSEKMTILINQAYEVLSDRKSRRIYDKGLEIQESLDQEIINEGSVDSSLQKAGKVFDDLKEKVVTLYNMFSDSIKGDYKPKAMTIGMIVFALGYFVVPVDFAPDFLPIIGYVDDASVIVMIEKTIREEMNKYRNETKR